MSEVEGSLGTEPLNDASLASCDALLESSNEPVHLRFRSTRSTDLISARELIPANFRYSDEVYNALPEIWAELLRAGSLQTAVIESPGLPPAQRLVGIGLSVFVTEAFAEEALHNPQPFLNARLHQMILQGCSPVLTRKQIQAGNSGDGLTLMPLHFSTRHLNLDNDLNHRVMQGAFDLFRLVHAGFNVHRVIKDVVSVDIRDYMLSFGMQLHSDYLDTSHGGSLNDLSMNERPFLLKTVRADLQKGSPTAMLFPINPELRFSFSPAEQKVLFSALLLEMDDEIAAELNISKDTLRRHWRSIYQKVMEAYPSLFPDNANGEQNSSRVKEKRRRLLQYLRFHMEELRPYSKK